jgi:hypothetical protein
VRPAGAWLFVAIATLAWGPIALADSATATLSVTGDGSAVTVDLRGPAAYLVGFERAPRDANERATLALAAENLKAGDGLVRFNPEAACRLQETRIDADPAPNGQVGKEHKRGELGASWRFRCDFPGRLDSAATGLFVGFPALARAHVRYALGAIRGEAVLTAADPVVTFVPLP